MHYFSLLHALAASYLSQSAGQLYGCVSPAGVTAFKSFPLVAFGETMYDTMQERNEVEKRANFHDKNRWYQRLVVRGSNCVAGTPDPLSGPSLQNLMFASRIATTASTDLADT